MEGHHVSQVEGLRGRDTISRTEGRDMVPTRNPVTQRHGPAPQFLLDGSSLLVSPEPSNTHLGIRG